MFELKKCQYCPNKFIPSDPRQVNCVRCYAGDPIKKKKYNHEYWLKRKKQNETIKN